jgi:antirestriction protein
MTIKQKFSSIDQSKLTADQKSFLEKIKNVTKNFTDAEMNKKVEAPLDNFISKAKEKMPEAVKSAPVKRTAKAKVSQTRKPKRTAMSLAKEIRKEGESWSDARARASKMMKEDSKDLSKTVETELDKLTKLVRSQKSKAKLSGISGTDLKRDASRKAKPRGARRVTHSGETSNQYGTFNNKLGRKYYESRDRHSDRLAPNYPKNAPLLENGAYLTDPTFGTFQNQVLAEGGDIDAFTLRMVKSNGMQPAEVLKEDANVKYAGGGFFSSGRPKSALMRDRKNVNHSEDYEVRYSKPRPSRTGYSGNRRFELGGTMATDLAGHTGGGDAGLNAGMPLDGFSNTGYTGLVGETGAMSSGEMFMAGGNLDSKDFIKNKKYFNSVEGGVYTFSNEDESGRLHFKDSKNIDRIFSSKKMYKVKSKLELGGGLPQGSEQSYMITEALGNPAQHFNKGGSVTNERKHVNKGEDYEVRYAKPRPHRKGYEGKRDFNSGGAITNERKHVNHNEDYEVRYAKPRPSRKGYKGARKFMAGGSMETPRIYVADLEAYNNGRLVGEWLDLSDYNDADELMDAIQDVLKKSGGEEYAIHDVEYVPRSMYSEYMGKRDFEELYEMIDLAKQNDLPLEVVQEIVSQYSARAVNYFVGKYDTAVDFAEQLVDDMGIESFNDFEYYLDISETDRRLLSQEMADSYVEDIRNEDGGNRLIEEAGLNVDEYEDASDETKEEMLDLASSMVNDEYYDTWYEGLNDPKGFLVDEQGMYSVEDFAKANFVRVDYDRLADALEQDYTFIEHDGDLYVFNIR